MSGAKKATKKPIDPPAPEVQPKAAPVAPRGIDLELWRKSMERIQRLFEAAALGSGQLMHYLIFSPILKNGKNVGPELGPEDLPPGLPPDEYLLADWAGALSPDEIPPTEQGFLMGWRSRFYGDRDAYARFSEPAEDAGQLIWDLACVRLPYLSARVLLDGLPINARNDEGGSFFNRVAICNARVSRWMLILHELGWLNQAGSPVRCVRFAWTGSEQLAFYDEEGLRKHIRAFAGGAMLSREFAERTTIPPERYYSKFDNDLFATSAHGVDLLMRRVFPASPPSGKRQTEGEREVWSFLSGKFGTGKQIGVALGKSEETVRAHVRALNAKDWPVQNVRGDGYFRPDSPPPALGPT